MGEAGLGLLVHFSPLHPAKKRENPGRWLVEGGGYRRIAVTSRWI